ncbi:MAG: hypothetical protein R2831_06675 [Chitinophagaceae bacterium]
MKKLFFVLLLSVFLPIQMFSQNIPGISYICKMNNIQQIDTNILQFEIWLQNFSTDTVRFGGLQMGIKFNMNGIKNGGIMNSIFLPNSASNLLPLNQQTLNTTIDISNQEFKCASQVAFYNSAFVLSSDSIRIGTFQIVNSVAFTPNSQPNFSWKFSLP